MTARRTAQSVTLAFATLLLSACGSHESDAGPMRSEHRQAGAFDSVDMNGSARLRITVGPRESVSVAGPEALIKRTTTEVHGDTLRVRTHRKDWVWANGQPRITVTITVPHLASLRLEGGNDARLAGFKGGAARIEVTGAAHVTATGAVDELTVDMEGAGFADLSGLVANAATVTVDGVGRVVVHPKDTLNATMNGIGAILYAGSPREVNTHMNGLGTISQRRDDKSNDRPRQHPLPEPGEPGLQVEPQRKPPAVNPDELEPEYDDRPPASGSMTEVI